jgi:hypothetical protein
LNNRVYIRDAVHEGTAYPGEHEAIITIDLWNRVHCILQESPRVRARRTRIMLCAPEIVVRTWRVARQLMGDIKEAEVREALEQLDPIWDELFPAEQARIVQLLVERVDVGTDGLAIRLRTGGPASLVGEMRSMTAPQRAA